MNCVTRYCAGIVQLIPFWIQFSTCVKLNFRNLLVQKLVYYRMCVLGKIYNFHRFGYCKLSVCIQYNLCRIIKIIFVKLKFYIGRYKAKRSPNVINAYLAFKFNYALQKEIVSLIFIVNIFLVFVFGFYIHSLNINVPLIQPYVIHQLDRLYAFYIQYEILNEFLICISMQELLHNCNSFTESDEG